MYNNFTLKKGPECLITFRKEVVLIMNQIRAPNKIFFASLNITQI